MMINTAEKQEYKKINKLGKNDLDNRLQEL